ncbi:MAG: hypothetical protein RLZZ308_94 [Candidatus Parcubacteria bacterium]
MKHILLTIAFLGILAQPIQSHATSVIGATEPTQLLNHAELIPTAIATVATEINTLTDMTWNTILDPIANELINVTLEDTSDDILSWIQGGYGGDQPLIIENPDDYITEQGDLVVREALTAVPEDSIFGESIFASILESNKKTTLEEEIEAISDSRIPELVQKNLCNEESLSSQTGNSEEKQELYDYACSGDPSDPETAAKLQDLYEQDPSVAGWDGWLAITDGRRAENEYTKNTLAIETTAEYKNRKEYLEERGLYDGENTISQTECVEKEIDFMGEEFCVEKKTISPGNSVQNYLDLASTAGFQRMFNIDGGGTGVGILSGFAMKALNAGLSSALATIKREITSSSGGSLTNTTFTLNSITPSSQDLLNNPSAKASLLSTMTAQTERDKASLSELEQIDRNYLSLVNNYENKVAQVKQCYDSLVSNNLVQSTDSRVVTATTFYNNRMSTINEIKNTIEKDTEAITSSREGIAGFIQKIQASNSTEEINAMFSSYTSTVKSLRLSSVLSERKGEYAVQQSNVSRDTQPESLLQTCNNIRNGSN